ncbi:MAG: glycosyltransferase family 2 protein [Actinomycetota bacterium]|nr:glycosyltransferase family 2 protein [Actinomycetota bacterium]
MVTALVAVVTPVHDQAAFLGRALGSLLAQTLASWELVVVDDGSSDDVAGALAPFADEPRVRLVRHESNRGLGCALNTGLDATTAPLVAYLPADDVWAPDHLAALHRCLADGVATLAWTGVRHSGVEEALDAPPGHALQLVQVMHRRTAKRWTERAELESDDLDRLMWSRLPGPRTSTGRVTCDWTEHVGQRHKAIRESFDGGLNVFRRRYRVTEPLRLHSSDSGTVDEVSLYARYRRPTPARDPDGLHVLLVGELAFNPDRVLALVERGHRLSGMWTPDALGAQTTGPLPFGHVRDLGYGLQADAVRQDPPDVVYALLNWRAVPFAAAVRAAFPELPFVWHFKEAPQHCLRNGTWPQLVDLCTRSDGLVVSTAEEGEWLRLALPGRIDRERMLVLDGDLPKDEWFAGRPAPRLRERDGEIHTAVLGRPLGMDADLLVRLASAGIHTHLHGQVTDRGPTGGWRAVVDDAVRRAPRHVHVHPAVPPPDWVSVLSRYDAGWLHRFRSTNGGDLRRAVWDDLNSPARIPTLAAGGLPMLQQASPGSRVSTERMLRETGCGLIYDDIDDLVDRLRSSTAADSARDAVARHRDRFTFDAHVDELVAVLRHAVTWRI